jgi:copper chaperone CopZ
MKKLLFIITVLFMAITADAQFTKASLQATGLTCAMCSNAINKALEKLPFVETVRSDIKNSAFNISFRNDVNVDIDEIKNAVEDAGFAIGSLKMTAKFDDVAIANDKHIRIGDRNFHFLGISDQVLAGEKTITLVDKDYLTVKQFRKFSKSTKANCINTGKVESCCVGMEEGSRIFHVTI